MNLGRSVAAAGLILAVAGGCMLPAGPPVVGPAEPAGPILVVASTNRSSENPSLEYAFEAEAMSGGGGGKISCGSTVMQFGEVAGSYRLMLDDVVVASGDVPRRVGPNAYLVFQIEIAEDGSTTLVGPDVMARPPPFRPGVACE